MRLKVKGRRGGQRKKGRSKEEGEVKGRSGGQRKKGRSKEEGEVKGRRGGQRKKGSPKRTWKKQVEEESMKVGLRREDTLCRSMWSVGVDKIAAGLRGIRPRSLIGDTTKF